MKTTKWPDYKENEALSNLINATKKKKNQTYT